MSSESSFKFSSLCWGCLGCCRSSRVVPDTSHVKPPAPAESPEARPPRARKLRSPSADEVAAEVAAAVEQFDFGLIVSTLESQPAGKGLGPIIGMLCWYAKDSSAATDNRRKLLDVVRFVAGVMARAVSEDCLDTELVKTSCYQLHSILESAQTVMARWQVEDSFHGFEADKEAMALQTDLRQWLSLLSAANSLLRPPPRTPPTQQHSFGEVQQEPSQPESSPGHPEQERSQAEPEPEASQLDAEPSMLDPEASQADPGAGPSQPRSEPSKQGSESDYAQRQSYDMLLQLFSIRYRARGQKTPASRLNDRLVAYNTRHQKQPTALKVEHMVDLLRRNGQADVTALEHVVRGWSGGELPAGWHAAAVTEKWRQAVRLALEPTGGEFPAAPEGAAAGSEDA